MYEEPLAVYLGAHHVTVILYWSNVCSIYCQVDFILAFPPKIRRIQKAGNDEVVILENVAFRTCGVEYVGEGL